MNGTFGDATLSENNTAGYCLQATGGCRNLYSAPATRDSLNLVAMGAARQSFFSSCAGMPKYGLEDII
jgi:hypothetical protein